MRLSVHDPVMPLNAESDVPGGIQLMIKQLYQLLKDVEVECLDLSLLKEAAEAAH